MTTHKTDTTDTNTKPSVDDATHAEDSGPAVELVDGLLSPVGYANRAHSRQEALLQVIGTLLSGSYLKDEDGSTALKTPAERATYLRVKAEALEILGVTTEEFILTLSLIYSQLRVAREKAARES